MAGLMVSIASASILARGSVCCKKLRPPGDAVSLTNKKLHSTTLVSRKRAHTPYTCQHIHKHTYTLRLPVQYNSIQLLGQCLLQRPHMRRLVHYMITALRQLHRRAWGQDEVVHSEVAVVAGERAWGETFSRRSKHQRDNIPARMSTTL